MDAYERALQDAGGFGKFQLRYSIVYNIVLVVCTALAYVNIVMVLTVPPHHCRLPPMPMNYSEAEWKDIYIPLERDSKGRQAHSSCRMYTERFVNETIECLEGYEYDRTWYHSTAASENDWVCDRELLVADAFAYSRVGEVAGSLCMGWLGDKYGRKVPYIITLALMISGRAITAFCSGSFLLFVAGAILAALSSVGPGQSTMIISMETTTAEKRAEIVMYQNMGWAVGVTLLPLFYWWLRDWFPFLMVTTLTLVPYFMLSWKLVESPRWLWTMGRKKECLKQLKYIAKINGKRLSSQVERDLLEDTPEPATVENSLGPLALFSNKTLALNTLCILTMWFCSLACYAVVTMSSGEDNSEGNPFLRFAGQGFAEIPGYLFGACLANHVGRRITACMAFGGAAIVQVATIITLNSGLHNDWLWNMLLIITAKSCITAAYYVTSLIATEIYPTSLRQSGLSLGTVSTGIAFASTPYITYLGRRVDARMPGLIMATLCVFGGMAGSLLPETLNAALPETLQDAQTFGVNRRKNYFKLPQKNETRKNEFRENKSDFSQQT